MAFTALAEDICGGGFVVSVDFCGGCGGEFCSEEGAAAKNREILLGMDAADTKTALNAGNLP